MTVEVTWNGVALAKEAPVRAEQGVGRWFVELEQPMPVGTTLTLAGEVAGTVRVARVHEGLGAGMVVLLEQAAALALPADATATAAEAMVSEGDPLDATGAVSADTGGGEGGGEVVGGERGDGDKKDGNGHGRSKRKRSRR